LKSWAVVTIMVGKDATIPQPGTSDKDYSECKFGYVSYRRCPIFAKKCADKIRLLIF